jgi:hypothetical protein
VEQQDESSSSSSYYKMAQDFLADSVSYIMPGASHHSGSDAQPSRDKALSEDSSSMGSLGSGRGRHRSSNINEWNSSVLMSPTILKLFHNPYISVRGPGRQDRAKPQQSMEAVRNLIYLVPLDGNGGDQDNDTVGSDAITDMAKQKEDSSAIAPSSFWSSVGPRLNVLKSLPKPVSFFSKKTLGKENPYQGSVDPSSPEETASQLAEGTLRAFRDLALDEAVDLHASLRYWTNRWERPLLSWFEAGPTVWFSREGYNHQMIGQKVSQIQAVLARRLSTIGELQQHLLKSGWQRGVAQWGFLGEGGDWAAISGTDGRMENSTDSSSAWRKDRSTDQDDEALIGNPPIPEPYTLQRKTSEKLLHPTPVKHELPVPAPTSKTSNLPQRSRHHNQLYYTNLFVKKKDGGHISKDGTALAEWSVDAMLLVRNQLYRAANEQLPLPYTDNWYHDTSMLTEEEEDDEVDGLSAAPGESLPQKSLPRWASYVPRRIEKGTMRICDLPLLVDEVSSLLDIMERVMEIQRVRRLEKLKPPSWWRQNWFLTTICAPLSSYLVYTLCIKGDGMVVVKYMARKVNEFLHEHVVRPCYAIYHELTKGTEYFSDRAARETAIATLKKMIRSWLDETYPEMLEKDKEELSEAMDISLIEITKERSMKTIYELNSVLRMSFIEAQFIKKEMMNALVALDEMQASTNFNMNLAAITPFVLLVWSVKKVSSFVFYTTFKWGRSRSETYASFLHILTEIERLLIMRLNPPNVPLKTSCVLDSDDLGMLMLHLHELRTIMWNERRRFSLDVLRSVSEDLAELSGERGAVSVQQQLHIVERMSRTYAFLRLAGSKE